MKISICRTVNPKTRWLLFGIPVLFIAGSLMHFVYDWSGKLAWVGLFAPINESVWEHLKLAFWPMLVWNYMGKALYFKSDRLGAMRWTVSTTIALLVCPLVIVAFYYTYTGALGIESLFLDAFSLLLGITAGQTVALYLYCHTRFNHSWLLSAIALIILMVIGFTVFTFAPPNLPIFRVR